MAATGEYPQPDTILGSYKLLSVLGEGGMGRVYLAEHTKLGRHVALKLLSPEYAAQPKAVRRFFAEARAVNTINHENIVEITDFVEGSDSGSYYIMELLRGETLAQVLSREGALAPARVVDIASQIARALAATHQAGVVHRDLKPENVFLIEKGERRDYVKLLDFGVAKLSDSDKIEVGKTGANAIIGTPEYMSPEQVSGKPADFRSDIYSLGVILFQMLTGKVPFSANSFGEMVIKHLTVAPPRPSVVAASLVPSELEGLTLHCLAKAPEGRPASMNAVLDRLKAYVEAPRIGVAGKKKSWAARFVSMSALVIAAGLAWLIYPRIDAPRPVAATPAPIAPAKATVSLRFTSEPPGALIKRADGSTLGTTPLVTAVPRDERVERFSFSAPGYTPVEHEISLSEDQSIRVSLAKETAREEASVAPRRTKVRSKPSVQVEAAPRDKGDVIDPFAQ